MDSFRKKILIIPSWLYYKDQPWGSYFIDQADFLNQSPGCEIKILYGREVSKSYALFWLEFLKVSIFKILNVEQIKRSKQTETFEFIIPKNRRISDYFFLKLARIKYSLAYNKFLNFGWEPDLIHAQSGMDAGIYAQHISKKTGIPYVIIEHQVFVFHYYSKLRSTLIMDAFKGAKKTAAVSYEQRRQVIMNEPKCNPEVIWNLVNENTFGIDLRRRNKDFTVITILNSLPIKGTDVFLEAMAIVLKTYPEIKFTMIGKGGDKNSTDPTQNQFILKSKEYGIQNMGTFFPIVSRKEISDLLNSGHVYVCPSDFESFGIAPREAMMCGLPVVTTANGGVEDSINAETGLIVPVRDSEALAEAILQIKNNYSKYIPKVIRESTIKQCGTEAFLNSMLSFYRI